MEQRISWEAFRDAVLESKTYLLARVFCRAKIASRLSEILTKKILYRIEFHAYEGFGRNEILIVWVVILWKNEK